MHDKNYNYQLGHFTTNLWPDKLDDSGFKSLFLHGSNPIDYSPASPYKFCLLISHRSNFLLLEAACPLPIISVAQSSSSLTVLLGNWLFLSSQGKGHFASKHSVTKFNYILVYVNISAMLARWIKQCLFPSFISHIQNSMYQLCISMSCCDSQHMPVHRRVTHTSQGTQRQMFNTQQCLD